MRILHLSDLHFRGKDHTDSFVVIDAMFRFVSNFVASGNKIDLLIFSGDLVYSGSDRLLFDEAVAYFVNPLLRILNIESSAFLIAPGNHDINRDVVRGEKWVDAGITTLFTDNAEIPKFIDSFLHRDDYRSSPFNRLHHFYESFWLKDKDISTITSPFSQVRTITIEGCKIGIASFNSAWRATGEPNNVDLGKLIIGERVVDHALKALSDCQLKLGVFHHPISWQHESDQLVSRGRLRSEFDLLFCGHVHTNTPEHHTSAIGDCIISQGGALYVSRDYFNGFTVANVEFKTGRVKLELFEYSDVRRAFVPAHRLAEAGVFESALPQRNEGSAQVRIARVLTRLAPAIKLLGSLHIRMTGPHGPKHDIAKHFACPAFRTIRSQEALEDDDVDQQPQDTLTSILESDTNVILFGGRESGKTSLAHYIAFSASQGKIDAPRIPYVCDADYVANNPNALWQLCRVYIRELDIDVVKREMVESLPALVIIDNVDPFDEIRIANIKRLVGRHRNVRWVLMFNVGNAESILVNTKSFDSMNFTAYAIGDVPRREIRALAANWLDMSVDSDSAKKLHAEIISHLSRSSLPRSGYIISLLLWAFQQKAAGETLNEAVLLRNVIDFLLGRMDYKGALRGEFDYTSRFAVLQELAYFYKRNGRVIAKNEILKQLILFLDRTGLRFDAAAILGGLIGCGVLSFDGQNVSFRYSRFQDYFVAHYLRDNQQILDTILTHEYSDFVHELDLYTATYRADERVLDAAHSFFKAQKIPESDNQEGIDSYLVEGDQPDFAKLQLKKMRSEPMSSEKIDALFEAAERSYERYRTREKQEEVNLKPESDLEEFLLYIKGLDSYGKIARNLEFADKEIKQTHVGHCIDGWQQLLVYGLAGLRATINEIKSGAKNQLFDDEEMSRPDFLKMLSMGESIFKSTYPSIIAGMAGQSLGSEKIVGFVENHVDPNDKSLIKQLLVGFILLEISPKNALIFLRRKFPPRTSERWTACAIVNRLHTFYFSNLISSELQDDFAQYLAELDAWLVQDDNNVLKRKVIVDRLKKQLIQRKGDDKKR